MLNESCVFGCAALPRFFVCKRKGSRKRKTSIREEAIIADSIFENFFSGGFSETDTEFYKELHKKELKEARFDIDGCRTRLKTHLMSDIALSEEKANELLDDICDIYEWYDSINCFDEFVCGWKMGTRVLLESLCI